MLVVGVNSKRQRRPNVRLGEIGDVSAALSFGISHKLKESWEEKRPKQGLVKPKETYFHPSCRFLAHEPDFSISDPGISAKDSVEAHNSENWNPNSCKPVSKFTLMPETVVCKPKLDFGMITRKRRGRNTRGSVTVHRFWSDRISPNELNNETREDYRGDGFGVHNACTYESFKDYSDYDTSDKSKNASMNGNVKPLYEKLACSDSDELLMGNEYKGNNGLDKKDFEGHKMSDGGVPVNSVRGWLEDLGFAKYACLFEMHEVDEEALPLLTFEDLKEMGINAVGPRRKIFNAIQLLKGGVSVYSRPKE